MILFSGLDNYCRFTGWRCAGSIVSPIILFAVLWAAPAAAAVSFTICYDFGCRSTSEVILSDPEWNSVANLFPASNPEQERELISKAVSRMEYLVGLYTPTHRDIAGNLPSPDDNDNPDYFPGQLDCVDESLNTSRYMALFEQHGLLRFHRFTERVYRRSVLTQHWASAMEEVATGEQFVIDSWFSDNGKEPILVTRSRWQELYPVVR